MRSNVAVLGGWGGGLGGLATQLGVKALCTNYALLHLAVQAKKDPNLTYRHKQK